MLINLKTKRSTKPLFSKVERISDAKDFNLDWHEELSDPNKEVWRLRTSTYPGTLAYISLSYDYNENFVFVSLIERKQSNRTKPYENIGETLLAFSCLQSMSVGFEGVVSFEAKTRLIDYYRTRMNAMRIGNSSKMVIFEDSAMMLIENYLEDHQ